MHLKSFALVLASTVFIGCAGRKVYQMDTGYEKTSLPVQFDRDDMDDRRLASIAVSQTRPEKVAFRDNTPDSTRFTYKNSGWSVDGNLVWEFEGNHFGVGFGVSPVDPTFLRFGTFLGHCWTFNGVLLSGTGGLFLNNSENYGHFQDWDIFAPPEEDEEVHGNDLHWEIPLRANVGFALPGVAQPYFSYSFNLLGIGITDGGEVLGIHEGAGGILFTLPSLITLRVEASAMRVWMEDKVAIKGGRGTRTLPGGRIELSKEF